MSKNPDITHDQPRGTRRISRSNHRTGAHKRYSFLEGQISDFRSLQISDLRGQENRPFFAGWKLTGRGGETRISSRKFPTTKTAVAQQSPPPTRSARYSWSSVRTCAGAWSARKCLLGKVLPSTPTWSAIHNERRCPLCGLPRWCEHDQRDNNDDQRWYVIRQIFAFARILECLHCCASVRHPTLHQLKCKLGSPSFISALGCPITIG